MKSGIGLLGLLCFVSSCLAADPDAFAYKAPCTKLNVTIENKTHAVCYLIQKDIDNGMLISQEDLSQIPVGESKSLRVMDKGSFAGGPTVTLFYACGNSMVSLKNYKQSCIFGGAVTASIVSISDMDAQYQVTQSSLRHGVRGSIVWTLL